MDSETIQAVIKTKKALIVKAKNKNDIRQLKIDLLFLTIPLNGS